MLTGNMMDMTVGNAIMIYFLVIPISKFFSITNTIRQIMIECLHDDFYWRINTNSKTEERATAYQKQQQTTGPDGIERDRIGHGMKGQHRIERDRIGHGMKGQHRIERDRIG